MGRTLKYLWLFLLFPCLAYGAAVQSIGQFFVTDCNTITGPVANATYCVQTTTVGGRTAGHEYKWNGTGWDDVTGGAGTTSGFAGALSATPTLCPAGQAAGGILANGNATQCAVMSAGGDASTNTTTSVDSEAVLFSGTGGKTLKRATGSGIAKLTSGVLGTATAGSDYAPATSGTALLKGNGSGGFNAASAGGDYVGPTSGSAIQKGNGSGGLTAITPTTCSAGNVATGIDTSGNAVCTPSAAGDVSSNTTSSVDGEVALFSGTGGKTIKRSALTGVLKSTAGVLAAATSSVDYAPATSGSAILKGNGTGGFAAAVAGSDYLVSSSTVTKTIYLDAGGINVDGTNCTAPVEGSLNSSPNEWSFQCADNNASIFSGKVRMPAGYNGGTVTFTLSLFHGTTESITFAGAFSAQCRGAGDVIDATYGTAVTTNVSITTANRIAEATSTPVTPNGSCAGLKFLLWEYVVNAASFSPNAANSKVLGVSIRYTANVTD